MNNVEELLRYLINEAQKNGIDEYDMFLSLGEYGIKLKDFEGTSLEDYAKSFSRTHSWEKEANIDDIWRRPSAKELLYLHNCTRYDFETVLGFNTKSYWVYSFENHLLTGWFTSEEEARQWIRERGYLKPTTRWAIDFDMDF